MSPIAVTDEEDALIDALNLQAIELGQRRNVRTELLARGASDMDPNMETQIKDTRRNRDAGESSDLTLCSLRRVSSPLEKSVRPRKFVINS